MWYGTKRQTQNIKCRGMWFYFPLAENIDNKDLIKNFFTWAWVKVSSHYHRGKRVTIPIPRISWYFLIWDPFTSYFYVVLKQSFILIHAHSESIHITICCFISSTSLVWITWWLLLNSLKLLAQTDACTWYWPW